MTDVGDRRQAAQYARMIREISGAIIMRFSTGHCSLREGNEMHFDLCSTLFYNTLEKIANGIVFRAEFIILYNCIC